MGIIDIIITIIIIALVIGGAYYYSLLNGFKKLIKFEKQVKKNPSDALVKEYMAKYKKTFFPKKEEILQYRANFYHFIKDSSEVSYETKKELRQFLESQGVNILGYAKKQEIDEVED